mmetsp:Transcript_26729/g.83315  ORF Transcript_26729/g.83315 Transcript_26729/m.83315 type:complete len:264 (-) Transcript_26729:266-1057(-)
MQRNRIRPQPMLKQSLLPGSVADHGLSANYRTRCRVLRGLARQLWWRDHYRRDSRHPAEDLAHPRVVAAALPVLAHLHVLHLVLEAHAADLGDAPRLRRPGDGHRTRLLWRIEEHVDDDIAVIAKRCVLEHAVLAANLRRIPRQGAASAPKCIIVGLRQDLGVVAWVPDHREVVRALAVSGRDIAGVHADEVLRVANAWPTAVVQEADGFSAPIYLVQRQFVAVVVAGTHGGAADRAESREHVRKPFVCHLRTALEEESCPQV